MANSDVLGLVFVTDIKLGSKTFTAVVDTGSSDTWVANTGFTYDSPRPNRQDEAHKYHP